MPTLFDPLSLGTLTLPNRIWMAPLTRCRAEEGHIAGDLIAEHYAQRASAGLLIAEATMVMEGNSAFWKEPGIYSGAQIVGWQKSTTAVHAAGGRIFLQLWHGGRACHPSLNNHQQPVAPSPIAITDAHVHTPLGKEAYVVPRMLADYELPHIVAGFKQAAENAKLAGFDGIEVHGANGYLLDQFLRDGSNQRSSGPYGGSLVNRGRLLLEVIEAVSHVWGNDRVGVRISPLNSFNSMRDSDPVGLATWLAKELNRYHLAYLHVIRGDMLQQQTGDILSPIRTHYQGILVGNLGYTADEANAAVTDGRLDAVAFGVPFLANPDLPARFRSGAPLNQPDPATFYSFGPAGYNDYPLLPNP
ncbi:MAG: alkene reductase [Magnetococcales bacterium]|nr:alkene reductase [Magnetococcales bacterium]